MNATTARTLKQWSKYSQMSYKKLKSAYNTLPAERKGKSLAAIKKSLLIAIKESIKPK
jgi:hypothetical protein